MVRVCPVLPPPGECYLLLESVTSSWRVLLTSGTASSAVCGHRYVVPQLILLGNLLFPIVVYGYFVSAVDARGAAALLIELAGIAIGSALVAHEFLLPYVLQLEAQPPTSNAALASVATYWVVLWLFQLALLARYNTAPDDLEDCASERLRLAVERANPADATAKLNLAALSTVEEEAAALLEPRVGETLEGYGERCEGRIARTPASFMVARTAICAKPLPANPGLLLPAIISAARERQLQYLPCLPQTCGCSSDCPCPSPTTLWLAS